MYDDDDDDAGVLSKRLNISSNFFAIGWATPL